MAMKTIRSKIRLLLISFTLLLCLVFGFMLMAYSWMVEDNVFNRLVADEAASIEHQYLQNGTVEQPQSRFMTLYASWSDLPEHIQLLRQQSPDRVEFPLADGGTVHLTTLQLGQQQMILAADVSRYEVSRDYLPMVSLWLLLTVVMVCSLALYLSRRIARVAVVPAERLAKLVAEKAPGERVDFASSFALDEIGYLAYTTENSINQLQAALSREEAFTRDVSHELRTPVTVLRLLESKLAAPQRLDDKTLADLKSSVRQIEQTVAVLLALARSESLQQVSLGLLAEIEHCAINHHGLASQPDFDLSVDVAFDFTVQANQNLLHILLSNVFDNALNHGDAGQLIIQLQGNQLSFTNSVDSTVPADIFASQVKRDDSSGLGLGLNLIKRICNTSGWQVDAVSDQKRFCLTIQF
jgi:signal transduction histidine kinase